MQSNFENTNPGKPEEKKPIELNIRPLKDGFVVDIHIDDSKIFSPEFKAICDELLAQYMAHSMTEFVRMNERLPKSFEDCEKAFGQGRENARFQIMQICAKGLSRFLSKEVLSMENTVKAYERALKILEEIHAAQKKDKEG